MTRLHPLIRSSPGVMPGAVPVGPSNPAEVFSVIVLLRRRPDGPALPSAEDVGMQPPRQRKYISREDFESTFGADPKDVEAVRDFAAKFGLTVTEASVARRAVAVSGTAAQFSAALRTVFETVAMPGGTYRSQARPIMLPVELRPIVVGVLGLDNRPIAVPSARVRDSAWNPAQVERAQTAAAAVAREVFQKRAEKLQQNLAKTAGEDPDVQDFLRLYGAWCRSGGAKLAAEDHARTYVQQVLPAYLKAQQALGQAQLSYGCDLGKAWSDAERAAILAALDELDIKTSPGVAELYGFPAGTDGSGQCVGIIELGGGYRKEDLASYFEFLNVPMPDVSFVGVSGGTNAPGLNTAYDGEVSLDIAVAGGAAPGAKIVCYFAPLTAQGFIEAVHAAIHDRVNRPSVLSISWGLSEGYWLQTPMSLEWFEEVLREAALLGVSVCCAAGDYGSSTTFMDGRAWVDYPASSPYSIACGGTTLCSRKNLIYLEYVWNSARTFFQATGGGVSEVFPVPAWQEAAGVPPSVNPGGGRGRGVPDVAANADPVTGYLVQVDGRTTVICGTSSGAPLWAALLARINQSLGIPVGYINPYLYRKVKHEEAFRDIVLGNNGIYAAYPGWDSCSGWGVPNGTGLRDALGAEGI